jgi:uncharacterized protein DUF397
MSKTEQQEGMPTWRKSQYSIANGSCAEVAAVPGTVMVRDSVGPSNVQLQFQSMVWREFIAHIKAA